MPREGKNPLRIRAAPSHESCRTMRKPRPAGSALGSAPEPRAPSPLSVPALPGSGRAPPLAAPADEALCAPGPASLLPSPPLRAASPAACRARCHAAALRAERGCAPPRPGCAAGLQLPGSGPLAAGLQPRRGGKGERGAGVACPFLRSALG